MEKEWVQRNSMRIVTAVFAFLMLTWIGVSCPQIVKASERTFVHPGMLHTEESFSAMKKNIEEEVQPSLDTWDYLKSNGFSASDWQPRASETVIRGGDGSNFAAFHIDIRRAYQTALIWKISGSVEHGEAACRILNAWSHKMTTLTGNADRFLAAGIYGYELANVSEIMREHPDFDADAMEKLLLDVFYPMTNDFLTNHNDAHFGNYWANWDLCNVASMMAIGIYADRSDIYEQAMEYYRNGIGMGSLYNAMPYVYEEGLAQWQESGRDQGHTTLGISLCGVICEMAWNQGDDLYSLSDNRFLKAAEYVAKYNLMEEVPYHAYERYAGQRGSSEFGNEISEEARGKVRPVYSLVYNHYVTRMGLEAPEISKVLFSEDGYNLELECSNGDEFGWQTLTFLYTGEKSEGKENKGVLDDGVYRICSAYSGKSLVADEEGTLTSERRGSNEAEWWKFENTGDGEYKITNMATGQVLQIPDTDETYTNGLKIITAEMEDSLNQRFAVIPNEDGNYRMIASVNDFCICLEGESALDGAAVIQWKYYKGKAQNWIIEEKTEVLASDSFHRIDFTFDDEETGFSSNGAVIKGNCTLVDREEEEIGKAIYLDGSTEQYLTITDGKGSSLFAGATEMTISFEIKPDRAETNWIFYLAPDDNGQTYLKEKYIGALIKDGVITVERYNNNGKRPENLNAEVDDGWIRVVVVMDGGSTELYINNQKVAEGVSGYAVSDMTSENGVFYIGKANWGGEGEYYKGWIDNLTICDRALTLEQLEELSGEEEITPMPGELPYEDVEERDWFYGAVSSTYNKGIMTGIDKTHFGPYDQLSRAQFALILYRMENSPQVSTEKSFQDIVGDEWYAQAVLWAAENGIVNGYTTGDVAGCFGPTDLITREQMAVMMYRYAKYLGRDVSDTTDLAQFSDAASVSGFSKTEFGWAVASGIITGKENGSKLDPQGNTARCEAAVILQRF